MKHHLSGLLFAIGLSLLLATVEFKEHYTKLGQSGETIWMLWGFVSLLLGLGLALSMRGLFLRLSPRFAFVYAGCNLSAVLALFAIQISDYALFSSLKSMSSNGMTELLPILIKNAQSINGESRREKMAKVAYQYCGATIAYRRDDDTQALYAPDASDEDALKKQQDFERLQSRIKTISEGQINALPIIMTLNAACFLATFGIAIWWLAFRQRAQPIAA